MADPENRNPPGSIGRAGYREQWSPFGDPDANDPDPQVRRRFFGKYRGTVVLNEDPLFQNRLLVSVPDVFGLIPSSWAMPCVPMTGPLAGIFVRPPIGADVWVEFEQGDPDMPIWVGGFWATGEAPLTAELATGAVPPTFAVITLETPTASISISDVPIGPLGNICIRYGPETMITLDATGVRIIAPTVDILAPVISMTGDVSILGATEIVGDVTIVGAADVAGDVAIAGATEIVGDVAIGGAVEIAGLLNGLPPL